MVRNFRGENLFKLPSGRAGKDFVIELSSSETFGSSERLGLSESPTRCSQTTL